MSADNIAISLLKRFSEKQMPKASELEWLVSADDVPQEVRWQKQLTWFCSEWCYHRVSKKTSHLWLVITSTHVNGFWYFVAEMLPIKQAVKRHFTMPPQVTCASALPGKMGKHKNCFFTQMLYQCIARIHPVAAWFLQFYWLVSHTHAAVWLPKSCNQYVTFSLVQLWGMVQEKGSRERCSSWTVFTYNAPVRCLLGFLFHKVMLKH